MSWTSIYRSALRLLPVGLRRKHGLAMESLFARELGRARARGRLHGALVGVAGVWDVVRRGMYEQVRPGRAAAGEPHDDPSQERDAMDAHILQPTTRELLRRHAASFSTAFVALTVLMLTLFATRELPALSARGASSGTIAEALVFAVPFVAALSIPMAVLVAVLWEFTRLGADGTLAAARRERDGVRRLVVPVLGAAVGVAALAFLVIAEIVPRANERLVTVLEQRATAPSDRMMTITELRDAARTVRRNTEPLASAWAARYEVEVQKKFALPTACVVLALAAMAIALSVPRGGAVLVIGASLVVSGAYYMMLIAGESLADRLVVSPFVGMWGANALLLAAALPAVWRRRARLA
ncbi:MAG TPA: LptF/LptG family permease [Gemmatimonadaceae bacterium]|nr:LptF/LptG family permease [Gemmatimonadaceae bacterium]